MAALATLKPGFGEAILALLKSPQPSPPKIILTNLINEVNQFPASFALVLDDYHVISAPPIHEALTFLLEHLPPPMHIVLTTRTDPPLPLPRLRARHQLVEIRGDELRFTSDEASLFLNQVMRLNLSAADMAVLETRTEGWIAGLQMVALSMQGRADIVSFIHSFSGGHRYIIDYLMDEVLQQQPENIQQFLLQTSILNHLSGPLCDAVVGQSDSQATLEQLEQANLFLLPLDNERRWYRYHNLFVEMLRYRLQRLHPEQVSVLHYRASLWHEQHGLPTEAVGHALSAQDFERAAHLIEQVGQSLLMRSEMTTLLKWLNTLPKALIQTRPQLCIFHAWTLMLNSQMPEAEERLEEASRLGSEPVILGQVAAIRGFITILQGDVQRATELTKQALALLPTNDLLLRGITALNLGVPYFLSGEVGAAIQTFAEAAVISQKSGNLMIAITAQCQVAESQIWQGQLHQAFESYRRALIIGTTQEGQLLPGVGQVHIGLAVLSYEWDDFEATTHHISQGLHLNQQWGEMGAFDGYVVLANLKQAQKDIAGALEAIGHAEQLVQKFSELASRLLEAYRVRLWVRQGNLAAASRWATTISDLLDDRPSDFSFYYHLHEFEQLTLARILIAQASAQGLVPAGLPAAPSIPDNPASKALQLLEALYPEAVKLGRGRSVIEILLLQALAQQAKGDTSQAMSLLGQALTLAQAEGFVRLFVDEGAPMAELLARLDASPEGGTPSVKEYIHKLRAAFSISLLTLHTIEANTVDELKIQNRKSQIANLVEPLSERELEILQLIAAGQSNEEIAQTLVIALGTVKKHINNIYGKLDVHSRTQALVQAKALNLLP